MDISSISPATSTVPAASTAPVQPAIPADEANQRRQLIQAVKSVNESGQLGQNQLVFTMDRQTHRPIIRVENSETHEVVMQLPPDYVLHLAEGFRPDSVQLASLSADM